MVQSGKESGINDAKKNSRVLKAIAALAAVATMGLLLTLTVFAQQGSGQNEGSGQNAGQNSSQNGNQGDNQSSEEEWRRNLQQQLSRTLGAATQGQLEVVGIADTPIENIVEVKLSTGEMLFSTRSGDFLLSGDMFRASDQGLVNLSAQRRQGSVLEWIAEIPEEEMIIYSPEEKKGAITVFTDVDCTYCRQLHSDIETLLDNGIEIRYMAYPRGGRQSAAYPKMISVWCSDNRKVRLTQAKNGQNIPSRECDNPVLEHFELGNRIGITGTPALVMEDGSVIPGYIGAEKLIAAVTQQTSLR